jgi:glycosyltransferase involved in cell wall biosynthesis
LPPAASGAALRILCLTRYEQRGASSRQRCYQYIHTLERAGTTVKISPLLSDSYIRAIYSGRRIDYIEIARSYAVRICALLRSGSYDILWVEKEALPWLPAWLEIVLFRIARVKIVLDYDDPIFHAYDDSPNWLVRALLRHKIGQLMSLADLVVVGNRYIGDRARESGARIIADLPTVVDIERYATRPAELNQQFFTVGWIGSPLTSAYLELVRPALLELAKRLPLKIVVIGGAPSALAGLPVDRRMWSLETEAEEIARLDVGIMPLSNGLWERGKCGYKIIQYMASWLPVVASPVGANTKIVESGITGFLADSPADWVSALLYLWRRPDVRRKMGIAGRRRAEERYSLKVAAPQLIGMLRQIAGAENIVDTGGTASEPAPIGGHLG